MKNCILVAVGLTFQGCWNCPDPVFIEYSNQNKTIEVLNDDYYIKSVLISEYLPKEGYIKTIDSSNIKIEQVGVRGAKLLSILQYGENYNLKGNNLGDFLRKEYLKYEVVLEKFDNEKKGDYSDREVIEFVKTNTTGKTKYNSKHPCP